MSKSKTTKSLEQEIHDQVETLDERRAKFCLRALMLADHVSPCTMRAAIDLANIRCGMSETTPFIRTTIVTDADHAKALARLEMLMDAKPDTPEGDELEALAKLIEAYEETHHGIVRRPAKLALETYDEKFDRMQQHKTERKDDDVSDLNAHPENYIGIHLDVVEMAVRLLEAFTGCVRPAGRTPEAVLNDDEMGAETAEAAMRAAFAACNYFGEKLKAASPKSKMIEIPKGAPN